MKFTKMQGAGNDYIYINCFAERVEDPAALAVRVSDRHFGIGADGLVLICPSEIATFKMRIFNADGSEAKMCGNATRCVAKYVRENGMTAADTITLETLSGVKTIAMEMFAGKVLSATVDMGAPILEGAMLPALFEGETCIAQPLPGLDYRVTCISMGNPHCVVFVEDTEAFPLEAVGSLVEKHPWFPDRVNAEFVRVVDGTHIQMRVWERGSGETLACGTGACASVVACVLNGYCQKDSDVTVLLRGGALVIRWDSARNTVFMKGPAAFVCTGEIEA
ncbi:MAG: diaminopimelate epimerase [Oscillospiraceae bacterium]|jgi:diaminopimelate epimerase|nr:diaminopimelate epimerase [Oscillospiraceae bacterium]